jgi:predicted DNA-binding protein (UPF0251 family)
MRYISLKNANKGGYIMGQVGIFHRLKDSDECDFEKPPPFPSYNALCYLVELYRYEKYTDVAARESMKKAYNRASTEICDMVNRLMAEIQKRDEQIERMKPYMELMLLFTEQQGRGKRPSKAIQVKVDEIMKMIGEGISKREAARRAGVSEGTIRRIVKDNTDGLKNALARTKSENEAE